MYIEVKFTDIQILIIFIYNPKIKTFTNFAIFSTWGSSYIILYSFLYRFQEPEKTRAKSNGNVLALIPSSPLSILKGNV